MRLLKVFLAFYCMWNLSLYATAMAQMALPAPSITLPEVQVWFVTKDQPPNTTGEEYLLRLGVFIPQHHHGYLDAGDEGFFLPLAFAFPLLEEHGAHVKMLSHPPGERDETAHATVLRGTGEFTFHVRAPAPTLPPMDPLPLTLHYQICNDVTKLCYPPQERRLLLPLGSSPNAGGAQADLVSPQTPPQAPASFTLNEQLTTLFRRYFDNPFLAFGLVFAAGILALATPCVYPMLPITAAIFTARGEGLAQRKRVHAFTYFLGIICFYALLGAMAALTGTALSAVMTHAWVYVGFALLFVALGLSMLGLYEFTFFATFMTRVDAVASHIGGLSGTFVMGATTGLIVSPCVGPITGTILLDITGQAARTQALVETAFSGMFLRGAFLMTGFGLGLGLPFLLIGLLSSRLPTAGTWLTKTKYVLALPTLYFAYTYYMKGMEIAAISAPTAHMLLASLGALSAASLLVCWRPWQPRFLHYASSGLLLVIGILCLYGTVRQPEFLGTPGGALQGWQRDATGVTSTVEVQANLRWWRDFALAQQQARAEHKPLFIDFYANWCANCKAFQHLATSDQQLNAALQEAVLVKIYDTDPGFRTFQQDVRYPELKGVGGQPLLPLFAIYSPQGRLVWKGQDYQAVRTMIAQLDQARRVASNVMNP